MTQPNTSRRALLCAATTALAYAGGAAIVGGAVVVASEAKGATGSVDCSAWNAAVDAYRSAKKASDEHWLRVEKPAWDELQRTHPHPGSSFTVPARNGMIGTMRWYENDPDAYEGCHPPVRDAARGYRARLDGWAKARERLDLSRIHAESDEHLERISEAEDRLFETPAPDLTAVMVKLEALWADERDSIPDYNALVLADVRRLTGAQTI